jgi:hypothetical protein
MYLHRLNAKIQQEIPKPMRPGLLVLLLVLRPLPSGNKAFCLSAVNWALKGSGVLKMSNVSHRIVDGEQGPYLYRVKDEVFFECDITEEEGGRTKPYK